MPLVVLRGLTSPEAHTSCLSTFFMKNGRNMLLTADLINTQYYALFYLSVRLDWDSTNKLNEQLPNVILKWSCRRQILDFRLRQFSYFFHSAVVKLLLVEVIPTFSVNGRKYRVWQKRHETYLNEIKMLYNCLFAYGQQINIQLSLVISCRFVNTLLI